MLQSHALPKQFSTLVLTQSSGGAQNAAVSQTGHGCFLPQGRFQINCKNSRKLELRHYTRVSNRWKDCLPCGHPEQGRSLDAAPFQLWAEMPPTCRAIPVHMLGSSPSAPATTYLISSNSPHATRALASSVPPAGPMLLCCKLAKETQVLEDSFRIKL